MAILIFLLGTSHSSPAFFMPVVPRPTIQGMIRMPMVVVRKMIRTMVRYIKGGAGNTPFQYKNPFKVTDVGGNMYTNYIPESAYGSPISPSLQNTEYDEYGSPITPVLQNTGYDGYGSPMSSVLHNTGNDEYGSPISPDEYGSPITAVLQNTEYDGYGSPISPVLHDTVSNGYGSPMSTVFQDTGVDGYGSPISSVIQSTDSYPNALHEIVVPSHGDHENVEILLNSDNYINTNQHEGYQDILNDNTDSDLISVPEFSFLGENNNIISNNAKDMTSDIIVNTNNLILENENIKEANIPQKPSAKFPDQNNPEKYLNNDKHTLNKVINTPVFYSDIQKLNRNIHHQSVIFLQ